MTPFDSIPLLDLQSQTREIKRDILAAISEVIDSGNFILGKEVGLFEEEFAEFCQTRHAVGVANGTEALHLSLRALDIGAGDEVITAGNSFVATAFAIAYAGAEAVLVDIDEDDFTIDVDLIERAISPRTKAIIAVHLFGQPARMDRIQSLARQYGLAVIEDAAQAHGAQHQKRRAGTMSDAACFSFYPGKNLGAFGDGGAVVTNDEPLATRLRRLRNYGQTQKNVHSMLGYNSRLDTLQAAILLVKLPFLEQWTERRRAAARQYDRYLAESDFILPHERADARHVYHLYVARHPDRDRIIQALRSRDIFCGVHYPHPLNEVAPFRKARTVPDGLPVCSRVANEILSLPLYPEIRPEQIQRVVRELIAASQEAQDVVRDYVS